MSEKLKQPKGTTEWALLRGVLEGKPQNYKLAYLMTYSTLKNAGEPEQPTALFNDILTMLDEADKSHPSHKMKD
ncbi:hypothetical protein JCM16814_34650 [Desulfobaculum senezii]